MGNRVRLIGSWKSELLKKSKEAMLSAVQIYNNPIIRFKSEVFIVLAIIAWTYLLHAYYKNIGVEYRYFDIIKSKKKFHKTKSGAYKYWELERCLNDDKSPIDKNIANNLRFLIGIRHEIEHQMTMQIDDLISAKFQACCINYNETIKKIFDETHTIDKMLSYSLQFSSLSEEQIDHMISNGCAPINIIKFINNFDDMLSQEEYENPKFSYRVLFVEKTANRKGQADKVVEFLKADSPLAKGLNTEYALIKDTEKPKFRPKDIVDKMISEGYTSFNMHKHTAIWKELDGRNQSKGYGVEVVGTWYWYENWFDVVKKYLSEHNNT